MRFRYCAKYRCVSRSVGFGVCGEERFGLYRPLVRTHILAAERARGFAVDEIPHIARAVAGAEREAGAPDVKNMPDTVLVQLVERNLRWLSTRPPLLPAPEREALEAQPGEQTISVSQSKSAYEGLFIYTGTFEDLTPDKDTPVYAVLGGVCYEACPTEAGFQLLTPAGSGLSLLVCMDGVYQCLQATIE